MARRIMARRIMCGALEFDQESCEEVTFAAFGWSNCNGRTKPE